MNARQRRVARRRDALYSHFRTHPDLPLTLAEVCDAIGCDDGATSRAAIPGVRRLAEDEGWHFPPAVPANGHAYVLTLDPAYLIDPALHMSRLRQGVKRREDSLVEGIRDGRSRLPAGDRAIASTMVAAADLERDVLSRVEEFQRTVVAEMVSLRRDQRGPAPMDEPA